MVDLPTTAVENAQIAQYNLSVDSNHNVKLNEKVWSPK